MRANDYYDWFISGHFVVVIFANKLFFDTYICALATNIDLINVSFTWKFII